MMKIMNTPRHSLHRVVAMIGLLGLLTVTNVARAVPVAISGYDVANARLTGFGNWGHTYTGTITPSFGGLGDYAGGTGTMANGVIENAEQQIQLFLTTDNPIITLFLDGFYSINTLSVFGGDTTRNAIPGELDAFNLTIGGTTAQLVGLGFGTTNTQGTPRNDLFIVSGSGNSLDGLLTDRLILSNFLADGFSNYFSIAEFRIDGNVISVPSVPEPASLALFGLGLVGMAAAKRRSRHRTNRPRFLRQDDHVDGELKS